MESRLTSQDYDDDDRCENEARVDKCKRPNDTFMLFYGLWITFFELKTIQTCSFAYQEDQDGR